jgi:hypothetical protein
MVVDTKTKVEVLLQRELPSEGPLVLVVRVREAYFAKDTHGIIKHGPYATWFDNGRLYSLCEYRNNDLHGLCEEWYCNGQPSKRCTYNNNQAEGTYELWHNNGLYSERSMYKNGKLEGLRETWDKGGKRTSCCTFKDGIEVKAPAAADPNKMLLKLVVKDDGKHVCYYQEQLGGSNQVQVMRLMGIECVPVSDPEKA